MVFSSLLFVFAFLASNIVLHRLMPTVKGKNIIMLCFSLIFYAWGGPKYIILLLSMVFICWFFALRIEKCSGTRGKKVWLFFGCALTLGILGYFKYAVFFAENLKALTGFPESLPNIVLPIGISFYTFQLLSYVVDVYRGQVVAQKKYWLLLLYASLFHQCIAGPIVRYKDVRQDILYRKVALPELSDGIRRFTVGLAKKAVLANTCAMLADTMLPITGNLASASVLAIVAGSACYMLEIYLDFSAYSDMAIGMGLMVGFHYNENFNYPYIAGTITDFWRRWHISLSTFFRDYVYIPLGGNRCKVWRHILNMLIVWFLTGMWHGASWNFILWGLYYFVFLVIEKYIFSKIKLADCLKIPAAVVRHGYVVAVVFFGWILFRFTELDVVVTVVKGLFGLNGNSLIDGSTQILLKNHMFFLIFAVIAVVPLGKKIRETMLEKASVNPYVCTILNVFEILLPPVLLILSLMALVGDSYNPFLYFQF
ncbi:MAG: MBOAT family protein [Lachnospiraceae bacterium]|nr:MBOAT family protein [Lachnospiraceae bacterium]